MEDKKISSNELNNVNGGCEIIELDEGPEKDQLLKMYKLREAALKKISDKRIPSIGETLRINRVVNRLKLDCSNQKEIEEELEKIVNSILNN